MKLTPQIIAYKDFSGRVESTDPCYAKGDGYTPRAPVCTGNYACIVWRNSEVRHYRHIGRTIRDYAVHGIGIYLDGIIPDPAEMKRSGYIGVDSGLAGIFMNKPNYSREEWHNLLERLHETDERILVCDEGFFAGTKDGDGTCPVFTKKQDGKIVAIEIRYTKRE